MITLALESSCDETAAAVLVDDSKLLANVINTQIATHAKYGGVVPELASRKHLENIYPVVATALSEAKLEITDIDLLAVTAGPGLVGSLLVGINFIKGLSLATDIPFIGVDHMAGHLNSIFLNEQHPEFPFIALIASGGHSSIFLVKDHLDFILLGRTRDDAAGEAFDKVAKLLGFAYPGGPIITEKSKDGDPQALDFPRSWLEKDSFDFSFSGLKTSVVNYVHKLTEQKKSLPIADICASFQEAVVDVLTRKAINAALANNCRQVAIAGGVAANERFRELLVARCQEHDILSFMPPRKFCTDNGAMIAMAAYYQYKQDQTPGSMAMDAYSRSPLLVR